MCYECGCGHTNTVMSNASITDHTFIYAAKALLEAGEAKTLEEAVLLAKRNTYKLLKKELGEN